VEAADWLSGDHRLDGVLAAAGPHVDSSAFTPSASFQLVDLAPTVLAAVGAPASVRHSGRPLAALVGEAAARTAATEAAPADREPISPAAPVTGLDDSEAQEVEEHLRGLGYLE
jgi:hypothetical protein